MITERLGEETVSNSTGITYFRANVLHIYKDSTGTNPTEIIVMQEGSSNELLCEIYPLFAPGKSPDSAACAY